MNETILLIDDSPEIHPLVKAILSVESVEIHSATDSSFGLVLADSLGPDLILLDVDMPILNGFEVCKKLKTNPATADVPVIFLTGQSTAKEKVQGFGLGAVDYVTKPFIPAELLARVRASLKTRRAIRSLEEKALVDPLTGMWNRTMFDRRLNAEIALRARSITPLSIIMMDLDQFKTINDLHGHLVGDEVLKHVAGIVLGLCRTEDVACRFGGEEFVILCPNTTAADANIFAQRIRRGIEESRFKSTVAKTSILAGQPPRITASFGVAAAGDAHDRTMLQRADDAMYLAKQQGRNRVFIASAGTSSVALAA